VELQILSSAFTGVQRLLPLARVQRFLTMVIVTGLLGAVAPALSVARALSVYVRAAPVFH
jgi:hypothetical protein